MVIYSGNWTMTHRSIIQLISVVGNVPDVIHIRA